ncbi:MAG: SRPBCC family protein [Actinomycetota bacterium]|nr:SRPBCC family protein [Actinomycetota bacterium]
MAAATEHSVGIEAPIAVVWEITNDVRQWPALFTEYASVEVLEERPGYVRFRLTMHPDENGVAWSWISERDLDKSTYSVRAQRVETGPFEYMNIRWDYEADGTAATRMRWQQEFQMKPGAPVDDAAMATRIDTNTPVQMAHIKSAIEAAAVAAGPPR